MNKTILSINQVNELIRENRYKVNSDKKLLSRCIDGRYENINDLPALGYPGADIGELMMVFAASKSYGFEIDKEKVFHSLINIVGGIKNFNFHTDNHADQSIRGGGCGHFKQILGDLNAYNITQEEIDFMKKKLIEAKDKGANEVKLIGDHLEGAVLLIKGNWGVYPQNQLETDHGKRLVQVFIYHQSLVDERHREWVKALVKNKAITFKNGEDEDWLYNALSDVSENHLMETAKRLAKGLPIFSVVFEDNGNFKVEQQGNV